MSLVGGCHVSDEPVVGPGGILEVDLRSSVDVEARVLCDRPLQSEKKTAEQADEAAGQLGLDGPGSIGVVLGAQTPPIWIDGDSLTCDERVLVGTERPSMDEWDVRLVEEVFQYVEEWCLDETRVEEDAPHEWPRLRD